MSAAPQTRPSLPEGMRIGERCLLHFSAPELVPEPQPGRLQELRPDGALCIDVAPELAPPRGTPVTISTVRPGSASCRFASEILGRSRLNGRLPVLLVRAPQALEPPQRRGAYRMSVALRGSVVPVLANGGQPTEQPAVVVDLSGGGARLCLRHPLPCQHVRLTVAVPTPFVEECAQRKVERLQRRERRPSPVSDPYRQACARVRALYTGIEAHVVSSRLQQLAGRAPIWLVSVAFVRSQEGGYRLVRYLERQAAQRGVAGPPQTVATAA
ncbi:MAG: hypothetical protein AB1505_26310 [Candidatus Latescibacterota bacterium]